jgi:hypothetical protein
VRARWHSQPGAVARLSIDGAAEVLGGGHLDLTPINPFVIARRQLGEPLLQVADRPPGHPLDGARNDDPVKRPAQPGTRLELDDNPVTEARVILDEVALVPCCGQAALDARVLDELVWTTRCRVISSSVGRPSSFSVSLALPPAVTSAPRARRESGLASTPAIARRR